MKRPAKYRQMANELAPDLTGRKPDASLRSIRGGRPGSMEVLIGSDAIQSRVREIGRRIARDHPAGVPLLIGVLRGCVIFMADLMKSLPIPHDRGASRQEAAPRVPGADRLHRI